LSKFRSGWWLKKRCQKYWPATSSQVQFDFSVSVKMMRVPRTLGVVAPDVEVALGRALGRAARGLEPRVLVGGVVDHQLGDHAQAAPVRLVDEGAEVVERAVGGCTFS
jgi:hypothetical protein